MRENLKTIRRLFPYYKPYTLLFISDMAAVTIAALLNMVIPLLLKNIIDVGIPEKNIPQIITALAVIAGMALVKFGVTYYTLYAGHLLAVRMERDMRRNLFYHLQKLSFRFFDDRKTGEIMSRMINDIGKVTDCVNHAPEDIFVSVLTIAGSFSVLMTLSPQLALIGFIPVPVMVFYSARYGSRFLKGFTAINDSTADINARVENSIAGIRVVRSFAREKYEKEVFDGLNHIYYKNWKGMLKNLAGFFSGIGMLRELSYLVILAAGTFFIFRGSVTVGTLVAFLFYVGIYLEPIERFTRTNEMIQRLFAGLKRFFEIMDEDPDITDTPKAETLDHVRGEITFEHVTFSYDHNKHIFNDLDLHIPAGMTVALVGPSGVGKTTFCSLIPRFYDVQKGTVRIDGIDVTTVTQESLRKSIGIVQQDVFLFTGTVRENLIYGRDGAAEEEIKAAARKANAHEFILELPDGYDTFIGEKGVKLSGGQKQRLSIARTFLKDPAILILDEATSSLDSQSERAIQNALKTLIRGRTTLIIAHRLSTIKDADEIIVLSENGIEQRGRHEELLRETGLYAQLYYGLDLQGQGLREIARTRTGDKDITNES